MPGAEPSRSTHRNSGKQKGSSKTVKSIIREAFINNFAVGLKLGPNGTWQSVNHKARGRRSQPREDTASLTSDRSNGSRGATRSVNDGNGFAEGMHAAGVLPGNAHPDNMHPDSVDQDINGRRQPSGDTASVASGKSNKSTGTRRSVNNGSGPTRSVHPGPGSGYQDAVGGGQAVGDTASVTSRKSSKSTKSKHSIRSGHGPIRNAHPRSIHRNSGGPEESRGDAASVASRESKKSTKSKHGADNGNGSTRSVHQDIDGRRQPCGDTASVTSRKSNRSTKSKHSVRSGKSSHSTGTRRNVDNGNGSAGGELPGSVHQDSRGSAEGLGEEDHGRGEDHDGGEVGGGKDDGGTEVVGEGHGAGTDENAKTSDAEQAHAGNTDSDLSEHSEERRAVDGRHVEDDHAGTGEMAIVEERDGDGNGEENTCRIVVVWERK